MIIYKIINKLNGKLYIGQTIRSLVERKKGHYANYLNGVHTKLYDAMRKYGWDNFEFEPICSCSDIKTLNKLETYFIKQYNTIKEGYNMCLGGDSNPMFSKEVYEKHHKRMQSLETRQKISDTMKKIRASKGFSAETRQKISEKLKGNKHFLGHKRTKNAIEKTIKSLIKEVYCVDENNKIVSKFNSVKEASIWWKTKGYNVSYIRTISATIKKSAYKGIFIKGLKWFYK